MAPVPRSSPRSFLIVAMSLVLGACAGASRELYLRNLVRKPAAAGGESSCNLNLTWLGGAGVHLSDGQTQLLIDPFVSRYGMWHVILKKPCPPRHGLISRWVRKLGAKGASAILVTHSHFDHALDAPFFARETGALLVGSKSTANIGRGAGLPEDHIRVVRAGDRMGFGRFRVRFLRSGHARLAFNRVPYRGVIAQPVRPPAPAAAYRVGEVMALLVEHPCGSILHLGSAGYVAESLEGVRADTVLLAIPGRKSSADLLANVVNRVQARRLIPIHFDDLFSPLDEPMGFLPFVNLDEFIRTTQRLQPNLLLQTLPIGRSVQVGRSAER